MAKTWSRWRSLSGARLAPTRSGHWTSCAAMPSRPTRNSMSSSPLSPNRGTPILPKPQAAAVVYDTDVASRSFKGRLPQALAARLVGKQPLVTFVTVGELTQWTRLRRWGPRNRAMLEDWLADKPVIPGGKSVAAVWGELSAAATARGQRHMDRGLLHRLRRAARDAQRQGLHRLRRARRPLPHPAVTRLSRPSPVSGGRRSDSAWRYPIYYGSGSRYRIINRKPRSRFSCCWSSELVLKCMTRLRIFRTSSSSWTKMSREICHLSRCHRASSRRSRTYWPNVMSLVEETGVRGPATHCSSLTGKAFSMHRRKRRSISPS